MPEPRASLEETGVHGDLAPKNGEEKSSHVRRFQLQAGKRGKNWGGEQGMTLGLAPLHVPSMAVFWDPPGGGEGGCHWRGLGWGLSTSLIPISLQVFLKEAAGNHPRSSGVSHASTGGPNTRAKAHSGAGVPKGPAVPIPSGSGSPALSMFTPSFPPSTRVKAGRPERPDLGT